MADELQAPDSRKHFQAFAGSKNSDYYLGYFQRAEERGYPPVSWNWPVFFFGWLWLLYRRLYRLAAIFFILPYGVLLLGSLATPMVGERVSNTLVLLIVVSFQALYMPLKANGFYYQHAKKLIEHVTQQFPAGKEKQLQYLTAKGGVNPQGPFIALSVAFILLSLIGQLTPAGA